MKKLIKEFLLMDDVRVVVFGSDENSFCVTASLIIKNKKALLIDTMFNKDDPKKIVEFLKENGVELVDIFISHSDPDFYFGLEEIKANYPRVIAKTTPESAKRITRTVLDKLVIWGKVLKEQTPENIVIPKVYTEDSFEFEGLKIEKYGSNPSRITLYIPKLSLVLGGPSIATGNHLFLADVSKDEDRESWIDNLKKLRELKPKVVIPAHTVFEDETFGIEDIDFSLEYLETVAKILPTVSTGNEFVAKMKEKYPKLQSEAVLELAGMVLTGEMQWEL